MELINIADMGGWGAFGALSLYNVLGFMKGWIRTSREMAEKVTLADKWEAAYNVERVINRETVGQIAEMLENSRTTVKVLEAIKTRSDDYVKANPPSAYNPEFEFTDPTHSRFRPPTDRTN